LRKGKEKAAELIGEGPESEDGVRVDELQDMVNIRIIDIPASLITLGNPNYLTLRLNSLDILLSLRVSLWSGLSRSNLYCPGLFNIMVLGYYL